MKILITDDSPDDRTLLARFLGRAGFGDLLFAESGEEAYRLLGIDGTPNHEIGLLLLDVLMPGSDGIEVCRRIKSDLRYRDLSVIMVTGKSEPELLEQAFDAGAVDFITKPIRKIELIARVRAAWSLIHALRDLRSEREALIRSEARQRAMTAALGEGLFVLDREGRLVFMNPEAERLLGWREEELLGEVIHGRVHRPDEAHTSDDCPLLRVSSEGGINRSDDDCFVRRDGSLLHVAHVTTPIIQEGQIAGSVTAFQDITERRQAEEQIRLSAKVFESTGEGIMITDANNRIVMVNKAFTSITGYTPEQVQGRSPAILSSGLHDDDFFHELYGALDRDGHWQGEITNRRRNGQSYPQWLSISVIRDADGGVTHHVAILSDLSERKAAEARIRHLAEHDALTGLPNRVLVQDRLQQALVQAAHHGERLAVLSIDLDNFKSINDSLGYHSGDALLRAVAHRIRGCLREGDTCARQGGDEYLVLMPTIEGAETAGQMAFRLIEVLTRPYFIDQNEVSVTPSIGIAIFPDDGHEMDQLLKDADAALHHAKQSGRNNYQFFTSDMNVRAFERLSMENNLRHALRRNEFTLYYQPQVDLASGAICGAEALLRWNHPDMGLVSPLQFIPIAEQTGLIIPIGEWVLAEACRQGRLWQEEGLPPIRLSVNLSAVQFRQRDIDTVLTRIVQESGFDPAMLEFELTESAVMNNPDAAVDVLRRLKEMGVRLAIDDFGVGYSSLSYLKRFPIDTLKIDKSFVSDIRVDSNDTAIAAAIIGMAHNLHLDVVAEGVEKAEQIAFLCEHACDILQGYYFSRPVTAEAMAELLRRPPAVNVACHSIASYQEVCDG